MSDHDSGDDRVAAQRGDEEELASKTLMIQSKRFYIDVKQNQRGRFIKIAEVGLGGRKNRLLLPMSTAAELRDRLTNFSEHYASLGPSSSGDGQKEDGVLKSDVLQKDNRRYFLDLKENKRGRFLRVSMSMSMPMSSRIRPQVVIPAQGMIEIRDTLTDLLNEFGTDDHAAPTELLPEPQSLRVDNKMFYFDVAQNRRGTFMRISEVRPTVRTAITIPQQSWKKFRDVLSEFVERAEAEKAEKPAPAVNGAAVNVEKPLANGEAESVDNKQSDAAASAASAGK